MEAPVWGFSQGSNLHTPTGTVASCRYVKGAVPR